jgi:predicted amidohydrolase
MNITLIQPETVWNNQEANISKAEAMILKADGTDLILLPETFNSGFLPAETVQCTGSARQTVDWLKGIARRNDAAVCTSIFERVNGSLYNRLFFVTPGGDTHVYDKRHLFIGDEKKRVTPGKKRVVVTFRGWRILLQICYDLRFPVWSRNRDDYDLAVYVANWPEPRADVWKTLLKARAMENQCYVAGVNRVGKDPNGIAFAGESKVIDPYGRDIISLKAFAETQGTADLSLEQLIRFRNDFPVLPDRDEFTLII